MLRDKLITETKFKCTQFFRKKRYVTFLRLGNY